MTHDAVAAIFMVAYAFLVAAAGVLCLAIAYALVKGKL